MMTDSEPLGETSAEISAKGGLQSVLRPESRTLGLLTLNGSNLERSDEMKLRNLISSLGPNLLSVNIGKRNEF